MGTKVTRLLLDGEVHEVLPERRDVSRTKWKIPKGRVARSQEFRESTRFEVTVVKAMGLRSLVLWVPAPKVHVLLHSQRKRTRFVAVVEAAMSKEGLGWVGQAARNWKLPFQKELLVRLCVRSREHRVERFGHWWGRVWSLGLLVPSPVLLHASVFHQGLVRDGLEAGSSRAVDLINLNGLETARQT
jgi:hypothetical protein